MKATELLKKQHRAVESLFKKLASSTLRSAPALLTELAGDLAAHMAIEQAILYPIARAVDGPLVLESFEEHAMARVALRRLVACAPGDTTFKAKVAMLKHLVFHHIEQEERELFPKLEKPLGAERLRSMGEEMERAFDAVRARGIAKGLAKARPEPIPDVAQRSTDGAVER